MTATPEQVEHYRALAREAGVTTAEQVDGRPWASEPDLLIGSCAHCTRTVLKDPGSGNQSHANGVVECEQTCGTNGVPVAGR